MFKFKHFALTLIVLMLACTAFAVQPTNFDKKVAIGMDVFCKSNIILVDVFTFSNVVTALPEERSFVNLLADKEAVLGFANSSPPAQKACYYNNNIKKK